MFTKQQAFDLGKDAGRAMKKRDIGTHDLIAERLRRLLPADRVQARELRQEYQRGYSETATPMKTKIV